MERQDIDKLLQDIKELQHSVRKANPFLRDIMALRAYAIMSLPLGILILAASITMHVLVVANGSFASIPRAWKIAAISVFALVVIASSIAKWIVIDRRARQIREGANFFSALEAMYGGHWFNLSAPLMVCMIVSSLYVAVVGHPWLILATIAIFLGPFCNIVAKLLDRGEYLFTGWYLILTGLVSLFFLESAPFIWLAIVWSGTFLVFGFAGLAAEKTVREERP